MFIQNLHQQYKEKTRSVESVVLDCINEIKKHDKTLNTFLTLEDRNKLLEKAKTMDSLLRSNDFDKLIQKFPLFGVPATLKDVYSTKDLETTAASNILKGYLPAYSATVVNRLTESGALILGKVNNDAFAHGASGGNSDFGPTKNPYNTKHVPGGSSSGSAVSVAANFCMFSMGTDTGGSIRNPASWCNLVGIKPTYGLVSRFGVIAMASSLDTMGHVTRTVEDNAKILNITAGYDPNDATSSRSFISGTSDFVTGIDKSISGKIVGLIKEFMSEGLDREIKLKIDLAIEILKKKGVKIVEISIPNIDYSVPAYYIICPSEVSSNLARFDGIRYGHSRDHFGAEAIRRIMIGTYTLSAGFYDEYYNKALALKNLLSSDFSRAFENVDAIVAPVAPFAPPKLGELSKDPLSEYLIDIYTVSVSLAGLPSLSIPMGLDSNCLPVGIQIIGNYFEESKLYNIGYHIESEIKSYNNLPDLK